MWEVELGEMWEVEFRFKLCENLVLSGITKSELLAMKFYGSK